MKVSGMWIQIVNKTQDIKRDCLALTCIILYPGDVYVYA